MGVLNALLGLGRYGGICDAGYNKAFNTGVNYGVIINQYVASLVIAHEAAHNCGAEHDPYESTGDACSPGGADGNFIMFAAATDGLKKNNRVFSDCSRGRMSQVMLLLQPICFVEAGACTCTQRRREASAGRFPDPVRVPARGMYPLRGASVARASYVRTSKRNRADRRSWHTELADSSQACGAVAGLLAGRVLAAC